MLRACRWPWPARSRRVDSARSATSHQWLRWTPSNVSSVVPATSNGRRFGERKMRTSVERRWPTARDHLAPASRRLACQPSAGRQPHLRRASGRRSGSRHAAADDLARRPQQRRRAPTHVRKLSATCPPGLATRTASRDERQRVVVVAVLQRDVAEHDVGRVVGQIAACGRRRRARSAGGRRRRTGRRSPGSARGTRRRGRRRSPCRTCAVKLAVIRPMPQPISTIVIGARSPARSPNAVR